VTILSLTEGTTTDTAWKDRSDQENTSLKGSNSARKLNQTPARHI